MHMITMSTPCCARRSKSASLKALEVKQGEEAAQDRGPCRGWWDVGDAGGGCKDELRKSVFFFCFCPGEDMFPVYYIIAGK